MAIEKKNHQTPNPSQAPDQTQHQVPDQLSNGGPFNVGKQQADNNQQQGQYNNPGYQQQGQPQGQQRRPNNQQRSNNLFDFATPNTFGTILPENMGTEYTRELGTAVNEVIKDISNIQVLVLDNSSTANMAYSCIVLTLTGENNMVAAYTMLLAATGQISESVTTGMKDDNIIVPSDAFDNVLRNTVDNSIKIKMGSNITIVGSGTVVVPEEFNPKDKNAVYQLVANAARACATSIEIGKKEFSDLVLGEANLNQVRLSIDISCDAGTRFDDLGQPLRTMFTSDLVVQTDVNKREVRSINLTESKRRLLRNSGFVDLIPYIDEQQVVGGLIRTTRYTPNIIINSMKGEYLTPAACILNLIVGSSVRNNGLWMEMIKPSPDDVAHDLGGLNYLTNLEGSDTGVGEKMDFSNATPSVYNGTLAKMTSPGCSISMDVEVGGPSSWYMGLFSNPSNKESLIRAANSLTGGKFSNNYRNGPIVTGMTKVPKGYYVDNNGERRSIMDIDLIAVINAFKGDIAVINDWVISGTTIGYNKKPEIIKRMLPNAVINGWVNRVTFNSDFIMALEAAVSASGFFVNLNSPNVTMGTPDFAQVTSNIGQARINPGASPFIRAAGIYGQGSYGNGGYGSNIINGWNY